jgi:hypothetical protein
MRWAWSSWKSRVAPRPPRIPDDKKQTAANMNVGAGVREPFSSRIALPRVASDRFVMIAGRGGLR